MKLSRILAMPFAVVADVVSLGNMGDRSFTQQLFDAESRDQVSDSGLALLALLMLAENGSCKQQRANESGESDAK